MNHPDPPRILAVKQARDFFRKWRNWDVLDWFFVLLCAATLAVILMIPVGLLIGGGGENASPGDVRTQRYECDWRWSPATKTNQRDCGWVTTDYQENR